MSRFLRFVNAVIMGFSSIMLAIMTTLVLLQVIWRYILESPFPQSQELAIYAMVYVVMFGSTIAVYKKSHIAVNIIVEKLPAGIAFWAKMIAYAIIIYFFYLLITQGWALSLRSMRQSSPTTGIPVGYIIASIPISSVISLVYILEQVWNDIKEKFHLFPQNKEN